MLFGAFALSCPGVVSIHRLPQSRPHHVRINLRGRNIGVPEHHLHTAQIRPPFQKVGGETMADHVGRHMVEVCLPSWRRLPAASRTPAGSTRLRGRSRRDTGFPALSARRRGRSADIRARPPARLSHRHDPLFVALAGGAQDPIFQIEIGQAQFAEFGDAQPGSIQQFEHGPVAHAGRFGRSGVCRIFSIWSKFKKLGIFCHCLGARRCSVGSEVIFPSRSRNV